MHFTRMGGYARPRRADHRARRRLLPRGRERQALPRRARGPLLGQHRLLVRGGDRARRRSSRCASCPSTPTGRTPTHARSSSPPRWPRSPPATSTASSSSRAARRRSSRRGSSRGSTTSSAARSGFASTSARRPSATTTRSSRTSARRTRRYKAITRQTAYHGTTLGALSLTGIPAIRVPFEPLLARGAERPQHEPLPPAGGGDGGGVHRRPARRAGADDRGDGAGDGLPRPHGAGPELGWLVLAAEGLLARRPRALRPLRHPPLRRRGDHRVRPDRRLVRARSATTSGRTSITCAKGLSSSYAAIGAVIATRPGGGAVPRGARCTRTGSPSAGIPCSARSRSRTSRS